MKKAVLFTALAVILILPLLHAAISEYPLNRSTSGLTLINGASAYENYILLSPTDGQYQALRLDLGDINAGNWVIVYFEGLSSDTKGVALTCYSNLTAPYYVKIAYWYADKEWQIIEALGSSGTQKLASASFDSKRLPDVVALAIKYTGTSEAPNNKIFAKVILADGSVIDLSGDTTYFWSRYAEFGVTGGSSKNEVKAKYLWLCQEPDLQTVLDKIRNMAMPVLTINIINAVLPLMLLVVVLGGLVKIISKVKL